MRRIIVLGIGRLQCCVRNVIYLFIK